MEPGGSLSCSQEPATNSCPESCESNPNTPSIFSLRYIFIISLPFTLRSPEWFLSFRLSNQNFVRISHVPRARHMPCPSHPPWFDHSDICWRVCLKIMRLLIMQFSLACCHFIPLRSKYSSQLSSQTPSICVLLIMWDTKFKEYGL
jgi:hypothetical protein